MKLIIFIFFLLIFYVLKAIATIGKGTIDIAKSAYETVYNPPSQKQYNNEKTVQIYTDYFLNLKIIIAKALEKNLDKNFLSYIKKSTCTTEDKQLLVFCITLEKFLFSIYNTETYYRNKNYTEALIKKIIVFALMALFEIDQKAYKIFNNFEDLVSFYTFERREYYRQLLIKLLDENYGVIGNFDTPENVLANVAMHVQWKTESNNIALGFAEAEYNIYKKEQIFDKNLKLSDNFPQFILQEEEENIIYNKEKLLFEHLEIL